MVALDGLGNVWVVWLGFDRNLFDVATNMHIYAARSTNGGVRRFLTIAVVATRRSPPNETPGTSEGDQDRSYTRPRPGWRNGIRGGLKIHCPKGHEGSNPSPGTSVASRFRPLLPSTAMERASASTLTAVGTFSTGTPSTMASCC